MPGLAAQTIAAASCADGGSTSGLLAMTTTTSGVPGRGERVEQGDLAADQLERGRRPALADELDAVTDDGDDVVGGLAPRRRPRRSAPRRASAGTTTCGRGWPSGKNSPSGSAPSVRISAPRACVTVQPAGTWSRKPSRTVCVISRGWPSGSQSAWPEAPAQSPSWVCWSSALGPTTAIVARAAAGERQRAVVGEQDERPAGHLEVELGVLGGADHRGLTLDARAGGGPRTGPARTSA